MAHEIYCFMLLRREKEKGREFAFSDFGTQEKKK
jgi:hypothetical protein